MIARSLFMDQTFETTETQQTLEAFAGLCRFCPYVVRFIFRIKYTRKHFAVGKIGRVHGIAATKTLINIDADVILIAVVIDAILFDSACVQIFLL